MHNHRDGPEQRRPRHPPKRNCRKELDVHRPSGGRLALGCDLLDHRDVQGAEDQPDELSDRGLAQTGRRDERSSRRSEGGAP